MSLRGILAKGGNVGGILEEFSRVHCLSSVGRALSRDCLVVYASPTLQGETKEFTLLL